MRLVRGQAADPKRDRSVSKRILNEVGDDGERAIRIWQPPRQVAFGRRDVQTNGYDVARKAARARGYPPTERSVGGRPVAFTGQTVAFARAEPVESIRGGLSERYDDIVSDVQQALRDIGVDLERREPSGAFCPGQHSLSRRGKVAGFAQRVRHDAAIVAGVILVADHDAVANVLEPVYSALDVPFQRRAIGSIARSGGPPDPDLVMDTLVREFLGDKVFTSEFVGG